MQELITANERRLFQELQTTKNLVQEQVRSAAPVALVQLPSQLFTVDCDFVNKAGLMHPVREPFVCVCLQL